MRAILQYRNTPLPDTRLSPAQIVFGRQMRDLLPTLNYKYEPKQEWGLVREYRERAMARRLDRDGARLEQYTKKQKVIPVGDTVAVQNQTGRFPKKWDKTGTVVENQEYDKVLVKLDGSGRLTTRNRRFVKKIVSPPDLPQGGAPQIQTGAPGTVHDVGDNTVPVPVLNDEVMEDNMTGDKIGINDENDVGSTVTEDRIVETVNDATIQTDLAQHRAEQNRPKRDRKQNVRYSSEEYDLSAVSSGVGMARMRLSGIYVHSNAGQLTQRSRKIRKI